MSDNDSEVVMGEQTSQLIQQQNQVINEANQKIQLAIQSFLEGRDIDGQVVGMNEENGRVKLQLSDNEGQEDE